jgi:predicted RNA-binding protein with PIN domain
VQHYLIDGYNVLFGLSSSLSSGKPSLLKKQRDRFISQLAAYFEGLPIHVTLVFDSQKGAEESDLAPHHFRHLEIIYTHRGLSADAYILSALTASRAPRRCVVITSDRELASQARCLGARVEGREQLLGLIARRGRPSPHYESGGEIVESRTQIERLVKIFKMRLQDIEDQGRKSNGGSRRIQ